MQAYLLHLLRERKLSRSSVNQYGCAFRFLYGTVLGLDGEAFQIPLARRRSGCPRSCRARNSPGCSPWRAHVKARTFLMMAYGTGLRLSELCHLRVEHIDSHADRMCIRVVQGKGAKDRYVPLGDERAAAAARVVAHRAPRRGCSAPRASARGRWT